MRIHSVDREEPGDAVSNDRLDGPGSVVGPLSEDALQYLLRTAPIEQRQGRLDETRPEGLVRVGDPVTRLTTRTGRKRFDRPLLVRAIQPRRNECVELWVWWRALERVRRDRGRRRKGVVAGTHCFEVPTVGVESLRLRVEGSDRPDAFFPLR